MPPYGWRRGWVASRGWLHLQPEMVICCVIDNRPEVEFWMINDYNPSPPPPPPLDGIPSPVYRPWSPGSPDAPSSSHGAPPPFFSFLDVLISFLLWIEQAVVVKKRPLGCLSVAPRKKRNRRPPKSVPSQVKALGNVDRSFELASNSWVCGLLSVWWLFFILHHWYWTQGKILNNKSSPSSFLCSICSCSSLAVIKYYTLNHIRRNSN